MTDRIQAESVDLYKAAQTESGRTFAQQLASIPANERLAALKALEQNAPQLNMKNPNLHEVIIGHGANGSTQVKVLDHGSNIQVFDSATTTVPISKPGATAAGRQPDRNPAPPPKEDPLITLAKQLVTDAHLPKDKQIQPNAHDKLWADYNLQFNSLSAIDKATVLRQANTIEAQQESATQTSEHIEFKEPSQGQFGLLVTDQADKTQKAKALFDSTNPDGKKKFSMPIIRMPGR
jgi:hypothetical protein